MKYINLAAAIGMALAIVIAKYRKISDYSDPGSIDRHDYH